MENTIREYLEFFLGQEEIGLLKIEDERALPRILNELSTRNVFHAATWQEVFTNLKDNNPCCIVIKPPLPKELYDIIVQYSSRKGIVQILDQKMKIFETIQCDPKQAHLLLIAHTDNLKVIEERFQIVDKVGMVEII